MVQLKKRIITKKRFSIIILLFLGTLLLEWIIGAFINIDTIAFITYLLFLYVIYRWDTRFILEYLWLVVSASMNLLGNYICDTQEVFLVELARTTSYAGSFIPLVIVYFVLFSTLEWIRIKNPNAFKTIYDDENNKKVNTSILRIVLLIGIGISSYLFLRVYSHPYFSVGASRIIYAQDYLTGLDRTLKTYLPLFMPIAIMYWIKAKKKLLTIIFFATTLMFYFWVGDKFGTFFFAIYIIGISINKQIEERHLKKLTISLFSSVGLLLGIVFAYRVLLYGDNRTLFMDYLMQRLAQQGEVWWSVYQSQAGTPIKIAEFGEEIKAILPFSNTSEVVGQWKMMLVSSHFSEYSKYRVEVRNPYTCTTTASLFYYFRWPGMIAFYLIVGRLYGRFVQNATAAIQNYRIIETLLSIKLLTSFHDMMFASDLYLISYKGLIYLAVLYCVIKARERNIKIGVRI